MAKPLKTPQADPRLDSLAKYVTEVLAPCTLAGSWPAAAGLPLYLQRGWEYQLLDLAGRRCLLMFDLSATQQNTAKNLHKAVTAVGQRFDGPVIYGVGDTTSYNRKRLIDQGLAFIVPGKQLYLPFMALDLRENFAPQARAEHHEISACAQQIILLQVYGLWQTQWAAREAGELLSVSKMTASRAYSELNELRLATASTTGRSKRLHFDLEGQAMWQSAATHLRSPVKKALWIMPSDSAHKLLTCAAGEWVLAQHSALTAPKNPCFALPWGQWQALKTDGDFVELGQRQEDSVNIELWRYDPDWLAPFLNTESPLDALSLYLSLKDTEDERVQLACEDMLNDAWLQISRRRIATNEQGGPDGTASINSKIHKSKNGKQGEQQ